MKRFGATLLWSMVCFASTQQQHLDFEPNAGQSSSDVRYLARSRGAIVFIRDNDVVLHRRAIGGTEATVRIEFPGAKRVSSWQPLDAAPGKTSYLVGRNSAGWIRDVPHFERLLRKNIFHGIDLVLYGTEGHLEYDFVLAPGADWNRVRLQFTGAQLSVAANGDLVVTTPAATIIQKKPDLYQTEPDGSVRRIDGGYRLMGRDRAAFTVGRYDRRRTLTIDPVLESATLLGGSGEDRVFAAAPSGGLVAGSTTSADFPGVEMARHSGTDVFVYDQVSQSTTIIGGSGDDIVTCASMRLGGGPLGGLLVGGYTNSRDLPATPLTNNPQYYQPFQAQYGGGDWDGFYIYFPGGTYPAIVSYVGGSGDDRVLAAGFGPGTAYAGDFAIAGSTTSSDFPVTNAWQPAPGGAMDGFAVMFNGTGGVEVSSYLGGSGDDRALAVAVGSSGGDFYIAGETRSSDWQLPATISAARSGPSDAFILHVEGNTQLTQFGVTEAVFPGGAGDDRITALTRMANGNIAAAGVTSSADFPASGGAQNQYGGGPSDVFVAQFSSNLQKTIYSSFFGGSGAEEPLSIATNLFQEVVIGGWTNSSDLPVADPLPSPCGRGPEDGFLLSLDSSGQKIFSSCYGGSGADRITSVLFDDSARILIGGISDSPDLLQVNPVQSANTIGPVHGFYGSVSVPVIHAAGLSVGKDLVGNASARLGDSTNYVGTPLTISSPDPTKVLLSGGVEDPGQPNLTIAHGLSPGNGVPGDYARRDFLVYCLTDSGTVPLILSAPGYASRNMNVRCVPSAFYVAKTDVPVQGSQGAISIATAALDPDTMQLLQLQSLRGGLNPIAISVSTSNPDFLQFPQPSLAIDQYSTKDTSFSFQISGTGAADVIFATSSQFAFAPSNTVHVHTATTPISVYIPRLARDLMEPIFVNGQFPITLTTSDPTKVLISTSPVQHGTASVTINDGRAAWLEVLDTSGAVSITASGPGADPLTVGVRSGELVAEFFYANSPSTINEASILPNQGLDTTVRYFVSPLDFLVDYAHAYYLRPDATPIRMRVQSSDASIAATGVSQTIVPGNGFGDVPVHVQAHSAGDAVVSILVDGGALRSPAPLTIHVDPRKILLRPMLLGYNLMAPVSMSLGLIGPDKITFTSSDPSRLLLSLDAQSQGQPSLTVSAPYSYNAVYAQALAGSGTVDITATAPGYTSGKSTVTLAPSGFSWSQSFIDLTNVPGSGTPTALIGPYALDPANGAALLRQQLRPGLDGTITLHNSNPDVVTVASESIALSDFAGADFFVKFTPVNGGDAAISLTQPPGFIAPAGRGLLRVKAPRPSLSVSAQTVGRNMQGTVTASLTNLPPGANSKTQITLSSSDPSKLLIASSNLDVGDASVTSRAASDSFSAFLNAVDGPVDVKITASAPGFENTSSVVSIVPSAILFSGYSGQVSDLSVKTDTQTDSVPMTISVAFPGSQYVGSPYNNASTLRPGLDPFPVTINSSNPAVAAVLKPPILNSLTFQAQFQIKPLAPGDAIFTVVPPPGFVLPPPGNGRTIKLSVSGPSFVIPNLTLGRDLQIAAPLTIQSGASNIPSDVNVTITSSDPSKVVLSTDAVTPGSASLTISFLAGNTGTRSIYIQALDQSGTVTITTSAPGYTTTSSQITLAPTWFTTQQNITLNIQNGPYTLGLRALPLVDPPYNFGNLSYQLRAGISGITIGVSSSNPAVASIPSQVIASAGTGEIDVPVQPLAAGQATLSFHVPDPYVAPASVNVQVQGGYLSVYPSSLTLGKDLQGNMVISPQAGGPSTFTITSRDPSRLLVSLSPISPGKASVTFNYQSGGQLNVYLQALSDTGTVVVDVTAAGYQSTSATFQLTRASVALVSTSQIGTLTTLSPPISMEARLIHGNNVYASPAATLRPGASPVIVPITLSDPTIGSLTPAQVTYNPGDSSKTFSFQPLAAGSALLSLGVPAGFGDPLSLRQQLITVLTPRLSFNGTLSVGKDLQRSIYVGLPSATAQPIALTLTSADPARLLLSTSGAGTPGPSVTLTLGSSQTVPFNLVGLADSGTVALKVSSPSLSASSYDVNLQPSGFVFSAPPASAQVGSNVRMPVMSYALNSITLAPDTNLPLRPGIQPVAITIVSSDGSVLTPGSSPLLFYPGDLQEFANIQAKSSGSAILTIQTPQGFATPSTGAKATVRVQ